MSTILLGFIEITPQNLIKNTSSYNILLGFLENRVQENIQKKSKGKKTRRALQKPSESRGGGLRPWGDPCKNPQILGSPYNKDLNEVPLFS